MSKSFVTMESKVCITCGCEYSTGNILMDRRMLPTFERDTVTGWGLCDQHEQAFREGFVALVEVDAKKSNAQPGQLLKPDDAYRTGRVALVKRTALRAAMHKEIAEDAPAMFIEEEAFNKLLPPEILNNAPVETERATKTLAPGSDSVN